MIFFLVNDLALAWDFSASKAGLLRIQALIRKNLFLLFERVEAILNHG